MKCIDCPHFGINAAHFCGTEKCPDALNRKPYLTFETFGYIFK